MTNALQTNTLARGERMHFELEMNVLVLEMNALQARIQTSAPNSYTCSSQRFSSKASSEIATLLKLDCWVITFMGAHMNVSVGTPRVRTRGARQHH